MTWKTALRERIKDVPLRCAWGMAPQGWQPPFAVLTVVSDARDETYSGPIDHRGTLMQIDIYHADYLELHELAEQVIAAIQPYGMDGIEKGFVRDARESGENTAQGYIHRTILDAVIWHN